MRDGECNLRFVRLEQGDPVHVVAVGVVVCNNIGRQGKEVKLPGYDHANAAYPRGCRKHSASREDGDDTRRIRREEINPGQAEVSKDSNC
ncbi:hypothetical protein AZE42_09913 [Rhizopogon vesiculosus]|uniref:Uncharacterized protein n=1 Tax=Rhizopogon vesiculosus TaxID=180088 RepID=A0A1J8QFX1_9AGAM|nr:hypothetical protein AZE42_09913 [Rhizopogon vesiculosus]